jgi:hypothetical protein
MPLHWVNGPIAGNKDDEIFFYATQTLNWKNEMPKAEREYRREGELFNLREEDL